MAFTQHLSALRKAVVLSSALAMVALLAVPAGAMSGNHGMGTGAGQEKEIKTDTDYGNPPFTFCLEVTKSEYFVDVTGDFWADDGTNTAGYDGPARVNWKTLETYYIAPEGIYTGLTANNECDPATLGDPVKTKVWVTDPVGNTIPGSITGCEDSNGEYRRLVSDITVDWTASCTVDGNIETGIVSTPSVSHHFEGLLDPVTGSVEGSWRYPS